MRARSLAGAAVCAAALGSALAVLTISRATTERPLATPGRAGAVSALAGLQADAPPAGFVRYVSPGGHDANDGSRGEPWRTVAHAARQVAPGTTVRVAPGRYAGPVVLARSGTAGARIRFVSSSPRRARISARAPGSLAVVEVRGDYVDLQGFDVTGSGGDGTAGIDIEGSHSRAIGNRVHDLSVRCIGNSGGAGIVAGGGRRHYRNHDVGVIGNVVYDIGDRRRCRLVHGIYAGVPRVRVVNNLVFRPAHDCITSWHAATELTIVNNTLVECTNAGITVGSGDSGATAGNRRTLVANNIVAGGAKGIVETSDGRHRVGPGNQYLNNLTYRAGRNGALKPGHGVRSGAIVSGTIHADPLFGARSFRLREGSPAIDAGTRTATPTTDLLRVRRPQGPQPDIGAYEWRPPVSDRR